MNDFELLVYSFCGAALVAGVIGLWVNERSYKRLIAARQKREATESYVDRTNAPIFNEMLYSIASSSQDALRRTESAAKAVEASADRVERRAREQEARLASLDTTSAIFGTDLRNPPSVDLASLIRKEEAERWNKDQ